MLTGGCACGKIRYEADGVPFNATLCHCPDCRRAAGSPCVAWFSVAPAALRFVRGEPKLFASSSKALRGFCGDCGTPLTFRHVDFPAEVDLTTCSLDDPDLVPPQDQIRTAGRVAWMARIGTLPTHSGAREASVPRIDSV